MKNFLKKYWHHAYWHALVWPLFAISSAVFGKLTENRTWYESLLIIYEKIVQNPKIIAWPFALIAIFRVSFSAFNFAKRKWLRLLALEQMAKDVGIRSFSHHNAEQKKLNWDSCESELQKSASQLCIMGAGGYETFSGPKTPLYEILKKTTCDVKILLLDPSSPAFSQRCTTTKTPEDTYRNWIYTSIEYCRDLQTNWNVSVEIRLYSDHPIWKMIFTQEYMWLQWYERDKDIHESQVYHLQSTATDTKTSLYYPLATVFQRRWRLGKKVNLSTWSRPRVK